MLHEAAPFLISTIVLIAAILIFFGLARGRYAQFGVAQTILRIIVALPLVLSAVLLHFLRTNEATAMLPPIFPAGRFLVIASGVFEILGAVGLFVPRARRSAALWIAIMMVLIFPVNVAVAGQTFGRLTTPGVPVRLAMQVVYIWMVLLAG
jgi:uncharacterized membrane protein